MHSPGADQRPRARAHRKTKWPGAHQRRRRWTIQIEQNRSLRDNYSGARKWPVYAQKNRPRGWPVSRKKSRDYGVRLKRPMPDPLEPSASSNLKVNVPFVLERNFSFTFVVFVPAGSPGKVSLRAAEVKPLRSYI